MLDFVDVLVNMLVRDINIFSSDLGPRLIKARDNNENFNLSSEEVEIICNVGALACLVFLVKKIER